MSIMLIFNTHNDECVSDLTLSVSLTGYQQSTSARSPHSADGGSVRGDGLPTPVSGCHAEL